MEPKNTMKQIASKMFLCQHKTITRDIKQVVTSMTVMTAKPVKAKKTKYLKTQFNNVKISTYIIYSSNISNLTMII